MTAADGVGVERSEGERQRKKEIRDEDERRDVYGGKESVMMTNLVHELLTKPVPSGVFPS